MKPSDSSLENMGGHYDFVGHEHDMAMAAPERPVVARGSYDEVYRGRISRSASPARASHRLSLGAEEIIDDEVVEVVQATPDTIESKPSMKGSTKVVLAAFGVALGFFGYGMVRQGK